MSKLRGMKIREGDYIRVSKNSPVQKGPLEPRVRGKIFLVEMRKNSLLPFVITLPRTSEDRERQLSLHESEATFVWRPEIMNYDL